MSIRQTLLKYATIIHYLERKKEASLKEIAGYLNQELDEEVLSVSERTFRRDRKTIEELFGIDIRFNPRAKKFSIVPTDQQANPSVTRLLEAFGIHQALGDAKMQPDFVHFESRKPANMIFFRPLLKAIERREKIQLSYRKFANDRAVERNVAPYGLKEFKNRWYLITKDADNHYVKTFALDRIEQVTFLNENFDKAEELDIEKMYEHCFGIISPEGQSIEEVVLSFDPFQGKYIKTLPLHRSQEILVDNEQELRVQLKVYLTYDFMMEILSYGDKVTVLQPQILIDGLKSIASKTAINYANLAHHQYRL